MTRDTLPSVSVIVPAYNAASTLGQTLESLDQLDYPPDLLELILVDNGSTDETPDLVRRHPRIRLVEARQIRTSYAARNAGLRHATGTLLAFTDADCVADPQWVREGVNGLNRLKTDLLAGAVDIPPAAAANILAAFDQHFYFRQQAYVREGYAATMNLFVYRHVFDKIGMFASHLISSGDVEFCLRARAAGFRLDFWPPARIIHPPMNTLGQSMRRWVRIGRGRAQLYTLHRLGDLHFVNPARYRQAFSFSWRTFAQRHQLPILPLVKLMGLFYLQKVCFLIGNASEFLRAVGRPRSQQPQDRQPGACP